MISETLDRMTRDENNDTAPAVEGSGGTNTIDYAQQIALLANRVDEIEKALNDMRTAEPPEPVETAEPPETEKPSVEETNITETSVDNPGETTEQKEEEKTE